MKGHWPVHTERYEEVQKHFCNETTIICDWYEWIGSDLCAGKTCTETLSEHLIVTNKKSSNTRLTEAVISSLVISLIYKSSQKIFNTIISIVIHK